MEQAREKRIHYIDVAKGILILMVVYGHVYGVMHANGIDNTFADYLHQSCNLFISFYMPCFFVITGWCSNFKQPFFQFVCQSFKAIVFPGITLSLLLLIRDINYESFYSFAKNVLFYGGYYWFLSSLFLARIIVWIVTNWVDNIRSKIIVNILLFVIGFIFGMFYHGFEPWWFIHALLLTPYISIGMLLKKHEINYVKASLLFTISFIITIVLSHINILNIGYFYHVPAITQMLINLNPSMFISLILLSVTGSLMILGLSKWISANRILEYLGRNSLIIYCVHAFVLTILIRHFAVDGECIKIVFIYLLTVLICSMISFVLNLKYIRFIIGKF